MLDVNKTKKHLKEFEKFGIDVENKTYQECVDEAIKLMYLYFDIAQYNEEDFLRREIKRALKPSN